MDPSTRVCPFCGEPPGPGVFCEACGRNLAGVDRLPTAAELRGQDREHVAPVSVDAAVRAFLEKMGAAGNPGTTEFPVGARSMFGRTRVVSGWVVRPVDREDFAEQRRYEPGLLLSVDGRFHRLDSELRGWGQRDFPRYDHTASPEPIDPPHVQRLVDELSAVSTANGADR